MRFYIQKSAYDKIKADIKTPTGKDSPSLEIKYQYIIHKLNHSRIFKKEDYENGIALNSTILAEKFGRNSTVKTVMDYLIDNNFIIKVSNHLTHVTSAKYKLHYSIENEHIHMINHSSCDSSLIALLEDREKSNSFKGHLSILQESIRINNDGMEYLKGKYGELSNGYFQKGFDRMDIGLVQIFYKNFFSCRPVLNSRVYSNLTSLKREHRNFIGFDGNRLYMTDIKNSQILLTVPLLTKYWAQKSGRGLLNLPKDVTSFQRLAETGVFYEHMSNIVNKNIDDADERAEFKKQVFADIWFSKNSRKLTELKKAFKKEFPTVFAIIHELKKIDHCAFAIKLQTFEASIVIDKVWKKLNRIGIRALTIHDSIVCSNIYDLEIAEGYLREAIVKYGIQPCFKREESSFIL